MKWNNQQPIYQQLKDKISGAILDGSIKEGEAIPSIRHISMEYEINPVTVSKAYQGLSDDNIIEKKRGLGLFVKAGATQKLLKLERTRFLKNEWPHIKDKIIRLGLNALELDL